MRYRTWTALLTGFLLLVPGCGFPEEPRPTPRPSPAEGTGEGTGGGTATPGDPEEVVTDLEVPWDIDFLPDGAALVTERDTARVLRVEPDGATEEVGRVEGVRSEGEGGLLGIAISPEFAEDTAVYAYHTAETDNRIVRMTYEPETGLGEPEVVLAGIPRASIHNGGRIAFGPDGMLYAGTGDADRADLAQDTDSLAGKILRMTPEGDPAPDNPFGNHVYSYGHRNVQGLAWEGQELFAVEFGPDADDEINLVEPGANYGWPEVTGRAEREEFTDPVVVWQPPEASPSGAAIAGGSLWVASLRGERLWRVPLGAEGDDEQVGTPEDLYVGEYGRLRAVVVPPGEEALWVSTSNRDGPFGEPEEGDDRILRIPLR